MGFSDISFFKVLMEILPHQDEKIEARVSVGGGDMPARKISMANSLIDLSFVDKKMVIHSQKMKPLSDLLHIIDDY